MCEAKMFKLKVTYEEYGGSFNGKEITSEIIMENNDFEHMEVNFERLKMAHSIYKEYIKMKPDRYFELKIPYYISFRKSEHQGSLNERKNIMEISFVDDEDNDVSWDCYRFFSNSHYECDLISAEIICGMTCTF